MSKVFRAKGWMTIAQLTGAWSSELTEGGEDPKQCEHNLVHILMEDILNGRLDDSGPLHDGGRLGLRLITPENRAAFIEGPQLLDAIRTKEPWLLHYVVVMKEAVLDFSQRHQLPSPSWWNDSSRRPPRFRTTPGSLKRILEPYLPVSGQATAHPQILEYTFLRWSTGTWALSAAEVES